MAGAPSIEQTPTPLRTYTDATKVRSLAKVEIGYREICGLMKYTQ
jgi:hypothetical protein